MYLHQLVELLEVRASAIELLEVMLEETHEKSRDLAQGISDDLNVNALLIAMLELEVNNYNSHLFVIYTF